MDATQKYLFNMLCEIDDICKKYDIEYFIDFGTTLGTIRHEGFIPWDDDIDINMTEANYYKWVEACKKELDGKKRVYSDGRLDRDFPGIFGRYVDAECIRFSSNFAFWRPICGQCIDVFYMMELPGDPVKKQEMIDLYFAYDEYANSSYRHFRYKSKAQMDLYNKFRRWEKFVGKERVLRHLEKKIFNQHYDDCDTYLSCSARKYGPVSYAPKYFYDEVYYADFEDRKFPISAKYAELLNYYYGDDWNIMPKDQKHHSKMSHTGISCADYVSDYMRLLDEKELKKERQKAKHIMVEEGYKVGVHLHNVYGKLSKLVKLKLDKKLKAMGIDDINTLIDETDKAKLDKLEEIFKDYYEKQLQFSVRYWECLLDIGDDYFYAAIFNMLYNRNDFTAASKIMKLYDISGKPKPERLTALWQLVLDSREIKAAMVYKEYDKAEKLIAAAVEKYPCSKEIELYNLEIKTVKQDPSAQTLAEKLIAKYPDNDRIDKAFGDIAYLKGDKETAEKYYAKVKKETADGMILLDIKKKGA